MEQVIYRRKVSKQTGNQVDPKTSKPVMGYIYIITEYDDSLTERVAEHLVRFSHTTLNF